MEMGKKRGSSSSRRYLMGNATPYNNYNNNKENNLVLVCAVITVFDITNPAQKPPCGHKNICCDA